MQIDENNDPNLVDELPAINGHVSAMVPVSEYSFITGSQDCTFRGWEVQDGQFLGEFNLLTDAPIKSGVLNGNILFPANHKIEFSCSINFLRLYVRSLRVVCLTER